MTEATVAKQKMVTAGNFKSGGVVYPPGSVVSVTAEDLMANPGNFSRVPKVASVEPVEEPVKGKK